jgi:iron complex outermembrane receptor protein
VSVKAARAALPGDLAPAYAGGQVASGASIGVLGKQKMLDVPFSVTSYTSKLIQDQQAQTVADVVANDPAVRTALGYGNFSETYIIRGFQVYSTTWASTASTASRRARWSTPARSSASISSRARARS